MTSQDYNRARILVRTYRRVDIGAAEAAICLGEDFTRDLPSSAALELIDTEKPALKAKIGPRSWILVTSRRLLISLDGEWAVLSPGQIESVTVNLGEDFRNGRTHKRSWKSMKLILANGDVQELALEGGESLLGMISAISWLIDHPFDCPDGSDLPEAEQRARSPGGSSNW